MSKVINYKTPVTQHETIIDVDEERRSWVARSLCEIFRDTLQRQQSLL